MHPNLTREVCHSPTWHSSESESARGRFEPVAMVMLWLDGTLAMFAPEGDSCLHRVKWEDTGRFSKEGKSLDDFWYFSSRKSTRRRKVSLCISRVVDGADPYKIKSKYSQHPKQKIKPLSAFSFAYADAKEKAIKKKTPSRSFALCGARRGLLLLDRASLPKGLT